VPSDNLPYLFAAYAVTWVGFFVYMFFMSRRQREMEREIEELRQELEERENPDESLSRINDGRI
jgi:CcmD family protein